MEALTAALAERQAAHLYRIRRTLEQPQGPEIRINGRLLLSFCSNDYLGLAADPRIIDALCHAAHHWGVGSGAAHLVSGHFAPHHALEEELAAFVHYPRALLFSSGYLANISVLAALLKPGDHVWQDRLNHASLIDGGLLSRAHFRRYPHVNTAFLAQHVIPPEAGKRLLIATDGVFSMDGDVAPLPELARLARMNNGWLLVDDAHGLGVLGAHGRGSLELCTLNEEDVPILIGTLGKAFGTSGAFIAGSEALIETLIQQARGFIYTTAAPPALAEATRLSVQLAQTESWRRVHLTALITQFRHGAMSLGLSLFDSHTPIQPVLAGSSIRALIWSQHLETQGLFVPAIRPPTVPEGQARLRITLSAAHHEKQVTRLLEALATLPTVNDDVA